MQSPELFILVLFLGLVTITLLSPPFPPRKSIHPLCITHPFISALSVDKSTTWLCLNPLHKFPKSRSIIKTWHHAEPSALAEKQGEEENEKLVAAQTASSAT